MKFSTKSTYGLRAMIRLAGHWQRGDLSLGEIAEQEQISLAYLERLFAKLKKAKLVEASRGAAGGYRLAREPQAISALEIIESLEGETDLFYCLAEHGKIHCSEQCHCGVNLVMSEASRALKQTLAKLTLKTLL